MVRYAFTRLLWILPSLFAVSLVGLWMLAWLSRGAGGDPRERFDDLPLLVNLAPVDLRARAVDAMQRVADDEDPAGLHAKELARLGGAALPFVLPRLAELTPNQRGRVALALAPVAKRMGVGGALAAGESTQAARFWLRFWEDRGVEFRSGPVESAVRRLLRTGSPSRLDELRVLDTFVLPALMAQIDESAHALTTAQARAVAELASRATGRDDRVPEGATHDDAVRCLARWRDHWVVYGSDFTAMSGGARLAAAFTETRYARTIERVLVRPLRIGAAESPALGFARRAPITLALALAGLGLAHGAGLILGFARRRGAAPLRPDALGVALVTLASAPLPIFFAGRSDAPAWALGPPLIALALVASPASLARLAVERELQAHPGAALAARGMSPLRRAVAAAFAPTLAVLSTSAPSEFALATSGAFLVEHALGLPGLCAPTIAALREREGVWLFLFVLFSAAVGLGAKAISEVTIAALDPRLIRGGPRPGGG